MARCVGLCTADSSGVLKVWDLSTFKCVQTTTSERGCPESEYDLDWPRDALLLSEDVLVIADSLGDKLMAVDIGATKCFNEATVLWTWTGLGGPYQVERL